MEKLQITHLAPYLPYGLKAKVGNETRLLSAANFRYGTVKYIDSDGDDYNTSINNLKPLLLPMSSLYTEMEDRTVHIVEIAKILSGTIHVEKIDGACVNMSYFRCTFSDYGIEELIINERCEAWYRSYFDKFQPNTGQNIINQFDVYQYLFSHHFDVFSLIPQNLAIDKTKIK